jgi:SAM-dependent methyltransferase
LCNHEALVHEAHELGPVIDLACGRGRHALHLARAGTPVIALDRSADHLRELQVHAQRDALPVQPLRCDVETAHGLPLPPESCGAILVFRFLYRPLANVIAAALRPGGVLLYETFTLAHRDTGRGPQREAFYLKRDELRTLFPDLEVVAFEEGPESDERPDITQRLYARKPHPTADANRSHPSWPGCS